MYSSRFPAKLSSLKKWGEEGWKMADKKIVKNLPTSLEPIRPELRT